MALLSHAVDSNFTGSLTSIGALDWVFFKQLDNEMRKDVPNRLIPPFVGTDLVDGVAACSIGSSGANLAWTDGNSPTTGSHTSYVKRDVYHDEGFVWTLPADTAEKTFSILLPYNNGTSVRVRAYLSDGSATAIDTGEVTGRVDAQLQRISFTYAAGSAGQFLRVHLTNYIPSLWYSVSLAVMATALLGTLESGGVRLIGAASMVPITNHSFEEEIVDSGAFHYGENNVTGWTTNALGGIGHNGVGSMGGMTAPSGDQIATVINVSGTNGYIEQALTLTDTADYLLGLFISGEVAVSQPVDVTLDGLVVMNDALGVGYQQWTRFTAIAKDVPAGSRTLRIAGTRTDPDYAYAMFDFVTAVKLPEATGSLVGAATPAPTPGPTPAPTPGPTPAPTPGPTPAPTPAPTSGPTSAPTAGPTSAPTSAPAGVTGTKFRLDIRASDCDFVSLSKIELLDPSGTNLATPGNCTIAGPEINNGDYAIGHLIEASPATHWIAYGFHQNLPVYVTITFPSPVTIAKWRLSTSGISDSGSASVGSSIKRAPARFNLLHSSDGGTTWVRDHYDREAKSWGVNGVISAHEFGVPGDLSAKYGDVMHAATSMWNAYPEGTLVFDETLGGIPDASGNASYPATANDGEFGPQRVIARASDPPGTIFGPVNGYNGGLIYDTCAQEFKNSITLPRLPVGIRLPLEGDGHLEVQDEVTDTLPSFFATKYSTVDGHIGAQNYSNQYINGTGWPTPAQYYLGSRAAGVAAISGVMMNHEYDDENALLYPHALPLSLTYNGLAKYPIFPAVSTDGDAVANTGGWAYGALAMLPPAFDVNQLQTREARKIARTFKKFGGYVTDRNTGVPMVIYPQLGSKYSFGQGDGVDQGGAMVSDLTIIKNAVRRLVSASIWRDATGSAFTPNKNLNLLSLRGPFVTTNYSGTQGTFETLNNKVTFPAGLVRQRNNSTQSINCPQGLWYSPKLGDRVRLSVQATGGAVLALDVYDKQGAAPRNITTADLGNGQTLDFDWPADECAGTLHLQGNTAATVSATLVKLSDADRTVVTPAGDITAKNWRIHVLANNGTDFLSLARLEARNPTGTNIAIPANCTVTAAHLPNDVGQPSDQYEPIHLIDGGSARWIAYAFPQNLPVTIYLNFTSPVTIRSFAFTSDALGDNPYGSGVQRAPKSFEIAHSTDDALTWTTDYSRTNETGWGTAGTSQTNVYTLSSGPAPTPAPTPAPATPAPTPAPTSSPTATPAPTLAPTAAPTTAPTSAPAPTPAPTPAATPAPTPAPTSAPTSAPTTTPAPTPAATPAPTSAPTSAPTAAPTSAPTTAPTAGPTSAPTSPPIAGSLGLFSNFATSSIALTDVATMNNLAPGAIAKIGRIVNTTLELDFAVQVFAVPSATARGRKVLSVYIGGGASADRLPDGSDRGKLVKIGEVGLAGTGSWSSTLSIAAAFAMMPPVADVFVVNESDVTLASSGHASIVLPASARWTAIT